MFYLKKYQWIAYGLDMFGYIIIEETSVDKTESFNKALKQLKDNNVDFDTLEQFDKVFVNRLGWLKE